jgi:hypothetical protein
LQGFQTMTARKAIRLGWIPRRQMPAAAVTERLPAERTTIPLEDLAQEQLPLNQGASADG